MQKQCCRTCGASLHLTMADLGLAPFSNSFVTEQARYCGEMFYPLRAMVCESCWLVQLDYVSPVQKHFNSGYVYFSSFSSGWLEHAQCYVKDMTRRFGLNHASQVVEIASNDGYLLQYFVRAGIPCLGIEPSANTAIAARRKNVETWTAFFDDNSARRLVEEGKCADLLLGNNVLAHVPNLPGFIEAMARVLKPEGVITVEFPYLLNLLDECQFDTIYHEHYSYLSLTPLVPLFKRAGLRLFDVEELTTHGGSLRLFACHEDAMHQDVDTVSVLLKREEAIHDADIFKRFALRMNEIRMDLLSFLIQAKRNGSRCVGYGAAAKGNTLLNYCGIRAEMLMAVADKNPAKQGKLLPGSRIPVLPPDVLRSIKPDYVLLLPWNLRTELEHELSYVRDWGGRFVTAIPSLEVF